MFLLCQWIRNIKFSNIFEELAWHLREQVYESVCRVILFFYGIFNLSAMSSTIFKRKTTTSIALPNFFAPQPSFLSTEFNLFCYNYLN